MTVFRIGTGSGTLPGSEHNNAVIGGKAASLVAMTAMGLNVPPAIVIPCKVTFDYQAMPKETLTQLRMQVEDGMAWIEKQVGRKCLFSVRSGAPVSCPGMMDTVLNVGLCKETNDEILKLLGNKAHADSWTRLREMYGTTVLGLEKTKIKDTTTGSDLFKMSAIDQVMACIGAVFGSWMSDRCVEYRKINNIPDSLGTAVTIQAMVYGNLNNSSGSGVLFTRNPSTGERKIMAEYLVNAQGEDVVAGTHDPIKLTFENPKGWESILVGVCDKLEKHYADMVDVEFTVENNILYILQSRKGKRTHKAAVKIATDLLNEGVATKETLKNYLNADQLFGCLGKQIIKTGKAKMVGKGLPAGGGIAKGRLVSTIEGAIKGAKVEPQVLFREETLPDDIAGMAASVGIITIKGGATSHAAVVSRAMNKACVVGTGPLGLTEGDMVVVNGDSGEIWKWDDSMVLADGGDQEVMQLAAMLAKIDNRSLIASPIKGHHTVAVIADLFLDDPKQVVYAIDAAIVAPDKMTVDLRAPHYFVHDDDKEVWGLLSSGLEQQWEKAVTFVAGSFKSNDMKKVVLLDPDKLVPNGKNLSQQVVMAHTVADAFSGKPVMLPVNFVNHVVGGDEMMKKLVKVFGEPKKHAASVHPYELIMKAIA